MDETTARMLAQIFLGRNLSVGGLAELANRTIFKGMSGIVLADEFITQCETWLNEGRSLPHDLRKISLDKNTARWIRKNIGIKIQYSDNGVHDNSWARFMLRFLASTQIITQIINEYPTHKNIDRLQSLSRSAHESLSATKTPSVAAKSTEDLHLNESSSAFTINIATATISDFVLAIGGWARNNRQPGIPVRLSLTINSKLLDSFLARTFPAPEDVNNINDGRYLFRIEIPVPEEAKNSRIEIVEDTSRHSTQVVLDQTEDRKNEEQQFGAVAAHHQIIGKVERVTSDTILGWALCENDSNLIPDLLLFINGDLFSHTRCDIHRGDVQNKYGGHGYYGFVFEIPDNVGARQHFHYKVVPAVGEPIIKEAEGDYFDFEEYFAAAPASTNLSLVPAQPALEEAISIIVLNQNGGEILNETLSSAALYERNDAIEWIIIDHQSSDNSALICQAAVERGQNVRFIRREGNFGFSDSNNFGAKLASNSILVFANNDLIFCEKLSDKIQAYLANPEIGVLGVKLLDYVRSETDSTALPVQHVGVYMSSANPNRWIRPFEARSTPEFNQPPSGFAVEVPAVTGALFAIRRELFVEVGGFDTRYFYGLEDIDLCLRILDKFGKISAFASDIRVIHHRAFSRSKVIGGALRRHTNNEIFNTLWASSIRSRIKSRIFDRSCQWTGRNPVLGFIVTDAGDETSAGEYYTASELGEALQKLLRINVRYIIESDWYDLTGIDLLIVMVNKFDIRRIKKASPYLVTVNWTRQWFDRWAEDPTLPSYDYIFASSKSAASYLSEKSGRRVDVLPIASNFARFSTGRYDQGLRSDYCFTGSRFGFAREIEFQLQPNFVSAEGRIFGYNWEGTPFEDISSGPVAYSRLPDVYASTRVVIDDANVATKPWGSCNSRVFDAMAAGCLLVTNGDLGVRELFGDLVPTFANKEELTKLIEEWTSNESARMERTQKMQSVISAEHTYEHRAATLINTIRSSPPAIRIGLKCAAKFSERSQWGDYHFAESLARSLTKLGFVVRVDCRESWYSGISQSDDVVIVLRGLLGYKSKPHQKNIMWLISHPNEVAPGELISYDHVYIASALHASMLSRWVEVPVEFLPQCTDAQRFAFDEESVVGSSNRLLFVGNSRGVFRDVVRWAVDKELDIDVFGTGWEPFLKDSRLKGNLIPNSVLSSFYASSKLVLSDHWDVMKRLGYVSNRLFDVLASGGVIATDKVAGLEDLVPGKHLVFSNADEMLAICNEPVPVNISERRSLSDWVRANHSFDSRAQVIGMRIRDLVKQFRSRPEI